MFASFKVLSTTTTMTISSLHDNDYDDDVELEIQKFTILNRFFCALEAVKRAKKNKEKEQTIDSNPQRCYWRHMRVRAEML